jgi:hypothetical protein
VANASYLDLADYLLIVEAVLGVPAEEIARWPGIGLAESALHAPAAGFEGVELYPDAAPNRRLSSATAVGFASPKRTTPMPSGPNVGRSAAPRRAPLSRCRLRVRVVSDRLP